MIQRGVHWVSIGIQNEECHHKIRVHFGQDSVPSGTAGSAWKHWQGRFTEPTHRFGASFGRFGPLSGSASVQHEVFSASSLKFLSIPAIL